MSDLPVIFDELPTACGGRIGVATLNAPRSLNSLSLEMAGSLVKLDLPHRTLEAYVEHLVG